MVSFICITRIFYHSEKPRPWFRMWHRKFYYTCWERRCRNRKRSECETITNLQTSVGGTANSIRKQRGESGGWEWEWRRRSELRARTAASVSIRTNSAVVENSNRTGKHPSHNTNLHNTRAFTLLNSIEY